MMIRRRRMRRVRRYIVQRCGKPIPSSVSRTVPSGTEPSSAGFSTSLLIFVASSFEALPVSRAKSVYGRAGGNGHSPDSELVHGNETTYGPTAESRCLMEWQPRRTACVEATLWRSAAHNLSRHAIRSHETRTPRRLAHRARRAACAAGSLADSEVNARTSLGTAGLVEATGSCKHPKRSAIRTVLTVHRRSGRIVRHGGSNP